MLPAVSVPQSTTPVEAPPGIEISPIEVGGTRCERVEWHIEDVRGKLLTSMGRPLVSPAFGVAGLPNLRLMVFPDAREAVKTARSHERKGIYTAMIKKGPLHGALKLKADCLERATVLRFHLTIGSVRRGPFVYDFAECAIHGCDDFNADWLEQIEASGCLRVAVEILDAQTREDVGTAPSLDETIRPRLESPSPVGPLEPKDLVSGRRQAKRSPTSQRRYREG